MRELAEIGLQAHWLKMAEVVGYDAFVTVWRMFSANMALRDDGNQIALHLRSVRSYDRYQRNRYVETLVASGCTNRQIFDLVRSNLGDWVTWRQIQRITQEIRTKERAKGEPAPKGHQYDLVAAATVAP